MREKPIELDTAKLLGWQDVAGAASAGAAERIAATKNLVKIAPTKSAVKIGATRNQVKVDAAKFDGTKEAG